MNFEELLSQYDRLPRPDRAGMGFVRELEKFDLSSARKDLHLQIADPGMIPETALESLQRQFTVGNDGAILTIEKDAELPPEAFKVTVKGGELTVCAADPAGIRYGIYELESLLKNGREGVFEKTPAVRHRITRSCFSPNSRPPLRLDELLDEVDYYPEAYLDRLAHERMNGVWITIYLNDVPSAFFPGRDPALINKKLGKLKKVVAKCARYGIKCYLFCSEPKAFNNGGFSSFSAENLAAHPELGGHKEGNTTDFCTSSPAGRQYLTETVGYIFSQVPGLGGMINIMCLEGSYPCGSRLLYPHVSSCNCPVCSSRTVEEIFPEIARTMSAAMKKHQPDAEFFGWFYAAIHYPGEPENDLIMQIAEKWPEDCYLLYNCETGGEVTQLGKTRILQDYSLSWAGPSEFWKSLSRRSKKMAAKIQTGCSHGNASVPYMPVPGILYDRYRGLLENNCQAVMQCWYFGAYPGLMNQAAGELSFLPFPEDKKDFLTTLCRRDWAEDASKAADAMLHFSDAAQFFPEVLSFKWYGPLHHELVFPWHLTPALKPLAPSYTLGEPVNSGDLIGECFNYDFTPAEMHQLLSDMENCWQNGVRILRSIAKTAVQQKETGLAEFILLQISGTRRWFEFYRLRDEMILLKKDHLDALAELIRQEIEASRRACILCEADPRLGYHSEVENFLIYPEKLRARIELLEHLLNLQLPQWDPEVPECRRWRENPGCRIAADEENAIRERLENVEYVIFHQAGKLIFRFYNVSSAKVKLDFLPTISCRVLSANLSYGKIGHWIGFPPGMEFFRNMEFAELRIDLEFFRPFRPSEKAPYFFNITVGKKSLSTPHCFPERLWQNRCNPADLLPLIVPG